MRHVFESIISAIALSGVHRAAKRWGIFAVTALLGFGCHPTVTPYYPPDYDPSAQVNPIAVVSPAAGLNWSQSSPTNERSITAQWTPSSSTNVDGQKIEIFSDDHCGTPLGLPVALLSGATNTYEISATYGQTYSFRILTDSWAGEMSASVCSSPLSVIQLPPNPPLLLDCPQSPVAASPGNACTLTPASPADPAGILVSYSDAGSTCSSVLVDSATGNATFTAPSKGGTCVVKVKANNGSLDSFAITSAVITGGNQSPFPPVTLRAATPRRSREASEKRARSPPRFPWMRTAMR